MAGPTMVSHSPFSRASIQKALDDIDAKDGNTVAVGLDAEPGARPGLVVEAQGATGRVTWAAWAKTHLTKASTAAGAKIGIRWP